MFKIISNGGNFSFIIAIGLSLLPQTAIAHDPIFGLGPHVIYEGGVEISSKLDTSQSSKTRGLEIGLLNLAYGINANLTVGSELPWVSKKNRYGQSKALGDLNVFTKYRFWHKDGLGVVDSTAALLKVKVPTSKQAMPNITNPAIGTGATDVTLGLTYGHESLTWYRWASVRYRRNGYSNGQKMADKVLLDLAAGWRPIMPEYLKPDMVWLLELNGEYGRNGRLNRVSFINGSSTELFLSPGFMWTVRNFAVRAGVQLPVLSKLNSTQAKTDYRARLQLEWHL